MVYRSGSVSVPLQDGVSSGPCGCGRAGTTELVEPSASNQASSSLLCITEAFWSFHE